MAEVGSFTGNVGSPGGGGGGGRGSRGNGQGAIEAKVGQLNSSLQSLKIVIQDLRQQGFQGGLIFEALAEKISGLIKTERELTNELEQQKIKFKDNKEQLEVYTKLQAKVQKAVGDTAGQIKSLTKEQIDVTRQQTRVDAEAAKAKYDANKQAEKSELSLLDVIKLRLNREGQVIEAAKKAYEAAEEKKRQIAEYNARAAEANAIARFKSAVKQQKQEEKNAKDAAKARFDADLKIIRSSKKSAKKRLDDEINYLKRVRDGYKENTAERIRLEGKIAEAEKKRRGTTFVGGLRQGFAGRGLGRALGQLTGIGGAIQGIRKVFQVLQKAITGSFRAAVEFEAQLAQLQAVTGVSNEELTKLSKSVLDVAGSTTFTAEEIVKLQTELGKLGFDPEQIIAATEGIARTAQALGEQVGPVAQRVGQILKQYNLTTAETEKVSDILVSTINQSALSFEGFGTAIQYVGPLAAQVGTEFQTVSAAMAILADNGFTASRIGTGLRGIFTELSVSGRDLGSAIQKLAEEQISFGQAIELVGKRNAGQLISLIENSDALLDLEDKYYRVGAANIAAAQQIDTFKGNLQLLNSALNRVGIEFGNMIKNSAILQQALRIIDEEGYKTSLAMETLSNANAEVFGEELTKNAQAFLGELEEIRKKGNRLLTLSDYIEDGKDLRVVAKQTLLKGLIEPLEEEALRVQQKLNSLGSGIATRKQRQELKDRLDEIREQIEFTFGTGRGGATTITVDYQKTIEKLGPAIDEVGGQLAEVAKQIYLDESRETVAGKYKEELEEMRDIREDEYISLEEAAELEFKARKRAAEVGAEILDQEEKIADLKKFLEDRNSVSLERQQEFAYFGKLELENEEAKLEALEQQKSNYQNIQRTTKELFAFAQKEYEKEFKSLQNSITLEKEQLKLRESEIKLRIQTIQNQLKQNLSEEEKKNLLDNQIELQKELLNVQNRSKITIDDSIQSTRDFLNQQRSLFESLNLDTRILDKALERLDGIELSVSSLKIDFPELEKAAKDLAKSFQSKFAKQLKSGQGLTAEQEKEVKDSVRGLIERFGISLEDLPESQRRLLEDYILSTLYGDPKGAKKRTDDLLKMLFGELTEAAKAYNKTALENTKGRLNAELEAIRERYAIEQEILKNQLNQNLITESQFRTKSEELKRKQLQEENEINKKIFDSEKKSDLINVGVDTAEALANNILQNFGNMTTPEAALASAIGNAIIVAGGAAKADAIRRRKFFPVQFEQGGFVEGPSHSQGGVPFTVQGQGGYEMEGGEFIVNKKAAAFHRSLLERINSSVKPNVAPLPQQFATGGLVAAQRATQVTVNAQTEESVNYLKAIAHASISTANDMKKPVRAVVSSKDLSNNETERRLRERNDRI